MAILVFRLKTRKWRFQYFEILLRWNTIFSTTRDDNPNFDSSFEIFGAGNTSKVIECDKIIKQTEFQSLEIHVDNNISKMAMQYCDNTIVCIN